MITKYELDTLRAQRRKPSAALEYSPNGAVEQQVNQKVDGERERRIGQGEQSLQSALQEMRAERSMSSHDGLAQAQFNQNAHGINP